MLMLQNVPQFYKDLEQVNLFELHAYLMAWLLCRLLWISLILGTM